MNLWAIVPFKNLHASKSRLDGALTSEERMAVSRDLLTRTLGLLVSAPAVVRTLLVSQDSEALALGATLGAIPVVEAAPPDLNRAVSQAAAQAAAGGATAVLVLPADLPLLTGGDIEWLCERAKQPPVVVLAPDRRGDGTNALLLSPPGLIEYAFGAGSYHRHRELAKQAGARVEVCDLPSLALDIDLVEDLDLLRDGRTADRTSHPPSGR